jgi:hypothetical protein
MPPSGMYKVFYHAGDELGIKTRVQKGHAYLDESGLHVRGPADIDMPVSDIHDIVLFRLHGLGRVVKIDHASGRLFISVTRFMIGQFATINFFKTGELYERLRGSASGWL